MLSIICLWRYPGIESMPDKRGRKFHLVPSLFSVPDKTWCTHLSRWFKYWLSHNCFFIDCFHDQVGSVRKGNSHHKYHQHWREWDRFNKMFYYANLVLEIYLNNRNMYPILNQQYSAFSVSTQFCFTPQKSPCQQIIFTIICTKN